MTQHFASLAIGTVATLLAIFLLLLRVSFQGRRPFVALIRRWVAADTRTSGVVLALLSVIAILNFASLPAHELRHSSSAAVSLSDEISPEAKAMENLRAYADKTGGAQQPAAAVSPASETAALPDVDTMIAKLLARLEKQPGDVKGWKILGWSYLNMNKPEEAAKAYETALKLDPNDVEIKKGLEASKSVKTAATPTAPSDLDHPATSSPAQDSKIADNPSAPHVESMIRGMVDQLATRLETSPNDEDGWLRLMRSRMTLGERQAAKAALLKALETFASDAAAKTRLTAAARELGVENN